MLPGDDPTYDPEMDRLPPYDPPEKHWYDRFTTTQMVLMVVFLLIQLVLTVVGIFGGSTWLIWLSLINLTWYFFAIRFAGRSRR